MATLSLAEQDASAPGRDSAGRDNNDGRSSSLDRAVVKVWKRGKRPTGGEAIKVSEATTCHSAASDDTPASTSISGFALLRLPILNILWLDSNLLSSTSFTQ